MKYSGCGLALEKLQRRFCINALREGKPLRIVKAQRAQAGGVFAFLASFDNYSVSLFVASVRARPLPIQMIQYLEEGADPTVASICTILIVVTAILLLLADRAVGLRRIAAG